MKSILLAGGAIIADDPLSSYINYGSKSLIPIGGKPMVQWVLDALNQSQAVDEIFMMGLDATCELASSKPLIFLPGQASLFDNIRYGSNMVRESSREDATIILITGDIPGLTTPMVDCLAEEKLDEAYDLVFSVIPRPVMEATFPRSNRSYIKFKDLEVCGADIHLINTRLMQQADRIWEQLVESRKNAMKQAALIGFDTVLLLLLKAITLEQTADRISRKLKIRGKILQVPFAEMGMNVDKPLQLELMKAYLSERAA
jgi:GTP:adenosylcobinamide-phosphate guanylyltransferase